MKPGGCPVASGIPRVSSGCTRSAASAAVSVSATKAIYALQVYTGCMESGVRVVEDNVEATEAWNGPLFEVWIKYRDLVAEGVGEHGDNAIRLTPPSVGDRVLDIGCGLGGTTVRLAEMVGPEGSAHGVDVAERMIQTAIAEARESGAGNVTFAAQDVEVQ